MNNLEFFTILVVINIINLILYGLDKRRAKKKKWRIKESCLLFLGVFGGGFAGLFAMKFFHHKTKKWYFYLFNFLGIIFIVFFYIFFIEK